jgi:hypothetical protein
MDDQNVEYYMFFKEEKEGVVVVENRTNHPGK